MAAPLTQNQIDIVKATAPVLKEHGVAITSVFYNNMLREVPDLNNIFSVTSQASGAQPRALAGAVLAYAMHIDDLGKLTHAVERIAHKHVSLQVTPAQYDIVGKYLIQAIGQVLGEAATAEIVAAWVAAYGVLAKVFIDLEGEMYKTHAAANWVGWRKFRIVKKEQESSIITSFYLKPTDGVKLPKFLPGQYVSLQVLVPELGYLQSRQYSMSEGPTQDGEYYRISVKREDGVQEGDETNVPGLISNMLHAKFAVGDEVELSHPQGEFFVNPTDATKTGVPAVLISAGVGATPLKSILDSLTSATAVKRPVSWIHSARSSATLPFGDAVRQICREHDNVTANVFLRTLGPEDREGVHYEFGDMRLDLAKLDKERNLHIGDPKAEYFLCGPEEFMKDVRSTLVAQGVDKSRVFLELFATGDVSDE